MKKINLKNTESEKKEARDKRETAEKKESGKVKAEQQTGKKKSKLDYTADDITVLK